MVVVPGMGLNSAVAAAADFPSGGVLVGVAVYHDRVSRATWHERQMTIDIDGGRNAGTWRDGRKWPDRRIVRESGAAAVVWGA